jgi:DNA polymerase iota
MTKGRTLLCFAGVAKMCPKEDALRVCPDLVLVNGEDLTPYRAVSKRILEVMRRFGTVERRGMDEAYLDITGGTLHTF